MSLAPPPMLLSPAEAARMLSITRQHLYNLAKRGDVRMVKLGRSTRVPLTEIERLAQGGAA